MSEINRCIFSGMQILIDQQFVEDHALIIEAGMIKAIIPTAMIKHHLPAKQYHFPADCYLCPGLIDLHIHGAAGFDVMDGTEEALRTISQTLATEGVTGFLATTMTADNAHIEHVLAVVSRVMADQAGTAILGIHLEGPFIAAAKKGAQLAKQLKQIDIKLFQSLQVVAKNAIRLVTLAPELAGALDLIQLLKKSNVIAAIGHTDATYDETCKAIAAGATQATHLFNAMRGMHQREPGALGALLLSEQINAELIVDGLHVHPAMVDLAMRLKGKERLLLVTDAMRAKCMADGKYDLGGQCVNVTSNRAALPDGTLAGSVLCLPQAIKNILAFSHCSLAEAIRMASYNPAHVLNLAAHKGLIKVGFDADLMVMNAAFQVLLTMRAGREIFIASGG